MDTYYKNFGQKEIEKFADTENTYLEIETENLEFENYNFEFFCLKIKYCRYLDFEHTN